MTVVIGVGNPLMGDDGLGIAAIAAIRERWDESEALSLVDGGTWGMNLLPLIESADRLLILDAIDRGVAPGSLIAIEGDEIPRQLAVKVSPHQTDLREALALAELRGALPRMMVAMGIQPAHVALSTELSAVVAAGLPALLRDVEVRLRQWGHEPMAAAHA
jgi:hydrogenase maturation protease